MRRSATLVVRRQGSQDLPGGPPKKAKTYDGDLWPVPSPGKEASPCSSPVPAGPHIPLLSGCRSVDNFRKLNRIDEGTYGVVYRARCTETNEIVALKQLKPRSTQSQDGGFPLTSLREISILMQLKHPNIVNCIEVVVGSTSQHIFVVFEYCEHELKILLGRQRFKCPEIKCLLSQLLEAVKYMHRHWVVHRDLKTSNLLFNKQGILKVCDFGLARRYGDPVRPYTNKVITLWYRPPELLLGQKEYSGCAADMWSVGCIFGEMILRRPLFKGKVELHQLTLIYALVGVPTEETWEGYDSLPLRHKFDLKLNLPTWREKFPEIKPGRENEEEQPHALSDTGLDLMKSLLECCPDHRCSAPVALTHPYFDEEPAAFSPEEMPQLKESNNVTHEKKDDKSLDDDQARERDQQDEERFKQGYQVVAGLNMINCQSSKTFGPK